MKEKNLNSMNKKSYFKGFLGGITEFVKQQVNDENKDKDIKNMQRLV